MIESIKLANGFIKLTATAGVIHKIGTDNYSKSVIVLPGETMDMYEEVAEKPAYSKEQYDAKVAELVRRRYTESEEFAIQRKALNTSLNPQPGGYYNGALAEYVEYNAYIEECKQQAKIILTENNEEVSD